MSPLIQAVRKVLDILTEGSMITKKCWKTTALDDFTNARVSICLQALGILEKEGTKKTYKGYPDKYRAISRHEGFWGQDRYDLEDILKEAKAVFKVRIKELHPDTNPEHERECRIVIGAFKQLKKLFAKHGIT